MCVYPLVEYEAKLTHRMYEAVQEKTHSAGSSERFESCLSG